MLYKKECSRFFGDAMLAKLCLRELQTSFILIDGVYDGNFTSNYAAQNIRSYFSTCVTLFYPLTLHFECVVQNQVGFEIVALRVIGYAHIQRIR